jgi:hypothetical protein
LHLPTHVIETGCAVLLRRGDGGDRGVGHGVHGLEWTGVDWSGLEWTSGPVSVDTVQM